jgi:signal transduction histidine kinase
MDNFFTQLLNLFVAPPGNVIYYLVLAFSIVAALQAVIISMRAGSAYYPNRLLVGLGLLLAAQVTMFLASGLVWQGIANPHIILPPLDRAVTAFGLGCLVWLWLTPAPNRRADAGLGVFSLVVVIAFFLTLNNWSAASQGVLFSGSRFDLSWEVGMLVVLVGGMVLLFVTRPSGWPVGIGILGINLVGHALQLLWPTSMSDFSGVVRLAQLFSYPLLPVIAQRLQTAEMGQEDEATVKKKSFFNPLAAAASRERRRYSSDPRTVNGWLQLAAQNRPEHVYTEFGRAFGQTMLADLCFVVRSGNGQGVIKILAGYDSVREEYLQGLTIPADRIPIIAAALHKGRPLRLGGDAGDSPDLDALAYFLALESPGTMMMVPLSVPPLVWGAVLMLSPYSNRVWNVDDQTYLLSSIDTMVDVLQRAEQNPLQAPLPEQVQPDVNLEPDDRQAVLLDRLNQLEQERNILQTSLAGLKGSQNPELDSLVALQKEAEETITFLQGENERLQVSLNQMIVERQSGLTPEDRHLEAELRQSLQQLAVLQNKFAETDARLNELQALDEPPAPRQVSGEDGEVINALVQELRQPMASIIGYTDLLLAESAGILGALQRKFLERVKGSIERMQAILNDLIQVTAMQSGPLELVPVSINASTLIDEAVASISMQLREKNITLRVDLPEELPELHADRDALQQIVGHLLQNASAASPMEGTVGIRVALQDEDHQHPRLLLEISDTGGGIDESDLPRVFSRRYRADNALIQGVGDTGVGLSIARMLVEAQHGQIWVESLPGQGATFRVLLPINPQDEPVGPKSA